MSEHIAPDRREHDRVSSARAEYMVLGAYAPAP
jgi:hypothetical protein